MKKSHSSPSDVKASATYTPGFSAIGRRSYDSGTLRANDDLQKIIKEAQDIILKNEEAITSLSREVAFLKGLNRKLMNKLKEEEGINSEISVALSDEVEHYRQFSGAFNPLTIIIENVDDPTPSSRESTITHPPEYVGDRTPNGPA
jgi:hypothetical protein